MLEKNETSRATTTATTTTPSTLPSSTLQNEESTSTTQEFTTTEETTTTHESTTITSSDSSSSISPSSIPPLANSTSPSSTASASSDLPSSSSTASTATSAKGLQQDEEHGHSAAPYDEDEPGCVGRGGSPRRAVEYRLMRNNGCQENCDKVRHASWPDKPASQRDPRAPEPCPHRHPRTGLEFLMITTSVPNKIATTSHTTTSADANAQDV